MTQGLQKLKKLISKLSFSLDTEDQLLNNRKDLRESRPKTKVARQLFFEFII